MPVKGYKSVSVPIGLLLRLKPFIGKAQHEGYRSETEAVADSVRRRVEFLELHNGNKREAD